MLCFMKEKQLLPSYSSLPDFLKIPLIRTNLKEILSQYARTDAQICSF